MYIDKTNSVVWSRSFLIKNNINKVILEFNQNMSAAMTIVRDIRNEVFNKELQMLGKKINQR